MASLKTDNGDLFYEVIGSGENTLVFCHGFFLNSEMFTPQTHALSKDYKCIVWDEKGCGKSSANGPFSYWDSADDAVRILDACGIGTATFIGMSKGGYISLRAALRYPNRVSGLVLIGSESGVFTEEEKQIFGNLVEEWQKKPISRTAMDTVKSILFGDAPESESWERSWNKEDHEFIKHAASALIDRDDITSRLGDIKCPCCVIHGTADIGVDIEKGRNLAKRLNCDDHFSEIENGSHAINMTHAGKVNGAIKAFLQDVYSKP